MTKQVWKIGNCLELIKEIPDSSIDLVIADPPYYKIESIDWDRQWDSFDDYLNWIEVVATEIKRVLKPSGGFYIFGDDKNIAYIQVRLDKQFIFLNHLIWYKRNNQSIKGAANSRRFCCVSERILFYGVADETGRQLILESKDCFRRIKDYLKSEYDNLMQSKGFKTKEECNRFLNELTNTASVVSRHYFCDSQWVFPTKEHYSTLQSTGFFQVPYEVLRYGYTENAKGYEHLKEGYESLRRPFRYFNKMYEVFDIPAINNNENTEHPTTKPIELIKQLITVSTKEGDSVLDPFLGSGTTLRACRETNRNGIGFEINPGYENIIKKRVMADIPELSNYSHNSIRAMREALPEQIGEFAPSFESANKK